MTKSHVAFLILIVCAGCIFEIFSCRLSSIQAEQEKVNQELHALSDYLEAEKAQRENLETAYHEVYSELQLHIQEAKRSQEIKTTQERIEHALIEVGKSYPMVPNELIRAVIWAESRFDPMATSEKGPYIGLMQISPRWHGERATRLGVSDFYDIEGNIRIGTDYLNELMNEYDDIEMALMVYNMGPQSARELQEQGTISEYAKTVVARMEFYREEAR